MKVFVETQTRPWRQLPGKLAHAYLRTVDAKQRPLWFHAIGAAAVVCSAVLSSRDIPKEMR